MTEPSSECCGAEVGSAPIYDGSGYGFATETLLFVYYCTKCHKPCEVAEKGGEND